MTSVAVLDAMPSPWIWLMCCLRKLDENNWLDLMRITTLMLTFEFRITFSNVRLKRTHNGRSPYRCSLEILNAAGSNPTTLICAPTLFVVSLIIVNNYVRTFISLMAVWSFTLATLLGSLEVVENVVKICNCIQKLLLTLPHGEYLIGYWFSGGEAWLVFVVDVVGLMSWSVRQNIEECLIVNTQQRNSCIIAAFGEICIFEYEINKEPTIIKSMFCAG